MIFNGGFLVSGKMVAGKSHQNVYVLD